MVQAESVSPTGVTQERGSARKEFRPDIEGLRAVTLVAILLFHADVPGASGGYVGPDIFFIISGFVITGQLWREVSSTGTLGLRKFYAARVRRLLPVAALIGSVTVIASAVLLSPLQAKSVVEDGIACALYVGNYWFIHENVDYFGGHQPPSPFQHYWTLGVEEQFYLVWPLLIIGTWWVIRRTRRRTSAPTTSSNAPKRAFLVVFGLVAILSFALSLLTTYLVPPAAYFSLPTRAWDLAVGGMLALTANQWRRLPARAAAITGWAGLALIMLVCNQLTPATPYPGTAAIWPLLGTVLVIGAGCATPTQGAGRILAVKPMREMGRLSYSWYLWHWPVLVLAVPLLGHQLGLAGRLVAVLLSGGLGMLTLRFVETPLRYGAALRRSPLASFAVGAAATAIAVGVGVAMLAWIPVPVGRGAPGTPLTINVAPVTSGAGMDAYDAAVQQAFAQAQAAVAASAELKAVPSNLQPPVAEATAGQTAMYAGGCFRGANQSGQPECATGDTASSTTVALVGDSHAAMWEPAFRRVAEQRHWRLETLAKVTCPLQELPIRSPYLGREYTECEQWRAQISDRLKAEHPRLVVLDMSRRYGADFGFESYDPAWIDTLGRSVATLRSTGATVLVLGPAPDPHGSVPSCLSAHLDDATACAPTPSAALDGGGIGAERAVTAGGGGQYADLTDLFCTPDRCPVIVGNALVFRDDNHVTTEYAQLLAPVMGALADRALAGG